MPDKIAPHIAVKLLKRLIVIVYDALLLTALLFTVGTLVAAIMTFALNGGNAITEAHPYYLFSQLSILVVLLLSGFLFYSWFWRHGGQTLGMKTWHIQLVSADESEIDWKKTLIRFSAAILSLSVFGLGFFWCILDKDKRTWHDILSGTKLIQLTKK